MDTQATSRDGNTALPVSSLAGNFQRVLSSGVRFTGAAGMFSLQQFETAVTNLQGGKGFQEQFNKVQGTVDDVTKCLVSSVSQGKKEAIETVSNLGGQILRQGMEGLSAFDPREMLRAANNLAHKSTETISHWVSRKGAPAGEEPRLAADVLAG